MKTITFYSYKGGVGRSLILANVAKRLTELGKNVCMLDFDLEAPGLEFKFLSNEYENEKGGLVDFISSYTNDNILPDDILKYTANVRIASRKHHGWLKLIKAGQIHDSVNYLKKLMSIDWKKLFYTSEGKGYELILHLKALIEQQVKPDYLLVDSRTGITETSGITLSILADEVVLVAANNEENFFGSLLIMKSINENENITKPKVHFVLSRIPFTNEPSDREKEFNQIKYLKDRFKYYYVIMDDIYIIHSDRGLEEEESLKIGEIEKEGEICVDNDYLHFFDKVIKPDLTSEDIKGFETIVKAKKLLQDAALTENIQLRLDLLNESIELDDQNDSAYFSRAKFYESIGNLKMAEKDYISFFDTTIFRDSFMYHYVLFFFYNNNLYSELIEFTNKYPVNSLSGYMGMRDVIESLIGRSYIMLGQYIAAFDIYNKALTDNPESNILNFDLSDLYLRQNNISEAEKLLTEVIKRHSTYTEALYNMAIVQCKKENKEDTFIYIDRALQSDKTNDTKNKVASEPEFKKYYNEEAFQRILYKYNIRLKTEG